MRLRVALGCLLVTAACGSPTEGDDAGPRVDAGSFLFDAGSDAGVEPDAGLEADAGVDAGVVDAGFSVIRYPSGRTQSPLTSEVAAHLRSIAALAPSKNGAAFSKIGDSNTVNTSYLSCFAGPNVDLAGRSTLQPALDHFRSTQSFDRTSLSATVGWSAFSPLTGAPSPLQQEIDAAQPRYATVMFGTNDVGFTDTHSFGRNLFTLIDTLSMQGVVPILSAIPSRDDNPTLDAWVPRYNLVARGIAQARRVPFIDLHREWLTVPAHGLGSDGVHLNVYVLGAVRPCVLNAAGLAFGHNVRNLHTLEGLSRAWDAVEGRAAPDTTAPRIEGTGLPGDEVLISSLPFVDVRDTRTDGVARINAYSGCASAANESGREVLYKLELSQPTTVRVFVVSLGSADIDVHLLRDVNSGQSCVVRHDKFLVRQLSAGTHYLSLDTYQSSAGVLAGEYLVGVIAE
ncbi:MAG: SGNH/GDSL hydrolase family protein [Archangium sp.]|nr:SGNH/GDSL hydrolase family protein [Archangium sp.]